MNKTVVILAAALSISVTVGVAGWISAYWGGESVRMHRAEMLKWQKIAQDANAELLSARAWAAAASAGGKSVVLIPKGSILESSDGGKTFRVNEIGK